MPVQFTVDDEDKINTGFGGFLTIIGALAVLAYGIYIAIVMVRNSEIYLTDIQSKPVRLSVFESFRQVTPFDNE